MTQRFYTPCVFKCGKYYPSEAAPRLEPSVGRLRPNLKQTPNDNAGARLQRVALSKANPTRNTARVQQVGVNLIGHQIHISVPEPWSLSRGP